MTPTTREIFLLQHQQQKDWFDIICWCVLQNAQISKWQKNQNKIESIFFWDPCASCLQNYLHI